MKELIKKLEFWENRSKPLEPSEKERRISLKLVNEYSHEFINQLEQNKTFRFTDEMSPEFEVDGQIKSMEQVLELYHNKVSSEGINAASGGHMGYIPGGGIFASSLADYLVDVTNEYAGIFYASPGAVAIENAILNWMKRIFSYPENALGNLASGGSIANLIALTAARDAHHIKGNKIQKSVVYLSAQTHHCVTKALRIIGLEEVILRKVDLDPDSRIDLKHLEELLEKDKKDGLNPFLIVASAGTTDTGAIDPLKEIGEICQQHKLWYHIDAAYGGFFVLTESKKSRFEGIELSDSLVVDPHKGLFIPYGLGAVLIKDKAAILHSNHSHADYMQDAYAENSVLNPADLGPELTKHFRGMRLWLPLQLYGIEPFVACLEEKLLLTEYIRECLFTLGFKLGPEPDLSVTYFWYPTEINENAFNEYLLKAIHQDGSYYFSSTRINGKFVIRAAILSFRTKRKLIDKALEMIEACLIKTHRHFETPD